MKKNLNDYFDITDKKGNKVPADEFFIEVEKLLSKNFSRYSKSIIPLSMLYCGYQSPYESLMFTIGILSGYMMGKKGVNIKFKDDGSFIFPSLMFKLMYDLRKKVGSNVQTRK